MSNPENQLSDSADNLEGLTKIGAPPDPSEQPVPEVGSQPALAITREGRAGAEPAASSPISWGSREAEAALKPGIALCLSGGGYRAMLFHLGIREFGDHG